MSALHTVVPIGDKERVLLLAHLESVLESPAFAGSRRRQDFLRYVVQETLAGRGATIKETNIAVDVFGRSNDFDAQTASIVRVTAAEVRKRLAQAYDAGLGREVRIELPLGGYQPAFHFLPTREDGHAPAARPLPETPAPTGIVPNRRRARWRIAAIAVFATIAISAPLALRWAHPTSSIDLFWRPFLSPDRPVLITLATSSNLLYMPNFEKWTPFQPGGMIPTAELHVLTATYVGSGGALGAALFAEQLATRGQRFSLKFGSDMSFADLKQSPAILIGTTRWTQELTRSLRFHIQIVGNQVKMVDAQQADRDWVIPLRQTPELSEGYSLVTRLLRSESGHAVLIVAGMDARNTQAAVEFLSRDSSFDLFAKSAPRGWETKNFQVVLRNTIHGNSAGSLAVMASHVW
ncbi:MAG: hypothetical protein LAP40_15285 [Acidobacteriia bacterium]|nr:hypothetical protein [Terriglobia bacterium]